MAVRLASQATTLKVLRAPNTFSWVGTSRLAAMFQDGGKRNKGNAGWMNWSAAKLRAVGKPMITVGHFAVSGYRTDQFNFASAIAAGASNLVGDGPINSISQAAAGYTTVGGAMPGTAVTAANVVAVSLADIKAGIKAANDAGVRFFYVWERGAVSFTNAQIGQLNDFNRRMADYLAKGDDYRGVPNVVVLDPTPYSVITSNASAIALTNSVDGTHDNVKAAKITGFAFADKIAPYLNEMPGYRLRNLTQAKSGLGSLSLNPNPALSGSAAPGGTGNTGFIPSNFTAAQSGGVTGVFTIQATSADADGNTWGNEVKIDATATASGTVSLILALDRTNITLGDLIKGGFEIDVTAGATGVSGVQADIEWFPTTGGTSPMYDMSASTIGTDDGGYTNLVLSPDPLAITAYTGSPFTNLALRIAFSAAGSATVIVRKFWAERTPAV